MTDAVRAAQEAVEIAKRALSEVEREKRAAVYAVELEWWPKIGEATRALGEANRALRQAENAATADHEWTGRRVYRIEEHFSGGWSRKKIGETRIEGIVETYRHGVTLGRGHRGWCGVGEPIVRLLKKDGTPGLKTENLDRTFGGEWKLA